MHQSIHATLYTIGLFGLRVLVTDKGGGPTGAATGCGDRCPVGFLCTGVPGNVSTHVCTPCEDIDVTCNNSVHDGGQCCDALRVQCGRVAPGCTAPCTRFDCSVGTDWGERTLPLMRLYTGGDGVVSHPLREGFFTPPPCCAQIPVTGFPAESPGEPAGVVHDGDLGMVSLGQQAVDNGFGSCVVNPDLVHYETVPGAAGLQVLAPSATFVVDSPAAYWTPSGTPPHRGAGIRVSSGSTSFGA